MPNGTELARPFLPTKDFDKSKQFYEALGFEKTLDSDVAKGDWSAKALKRSELLTKRRPAFLKARFLYGSLLLANGRAANGAAELEAVIAIDRARAAPRVNLANAYLSLGRRADAEAQLRAALAIEPANTVIRARLSAMGLVP